MKEMQMKKNLVWSLVMVSLLMFSNKANAALTTIGTAQFGGTGSAYNLIWDDDNNGNSVVWLDYTNSLTNWTAQKAWAAGLDSALTLNFNAGVSVAWDGSWRLPNIVDGLYVYGYDGTTTGGYNITSSEMGHLFYTELGNKGFYATDGSYQSDYGLQNTGDFENLIATWYWSGTEHAISPDYAWYFGTNDGSQGHNGKNNGIYGLAVRSGQVSTAPVPVSAAIWLFASGLIGLIGIRRTVNK